MHPNERAYNYYMQEFSIREELIDPPIFYNGEPLGAARPLTFKKFRGLKKVHFPTNFVQTISIYSLGPYHDRSLSISVKKPHSCFTEKSSKISASQG